MPTSKSARRRARQERDRRRGPVVRASPTPNEVVPAGRPRRSLATAPAAEAPPWGRRTLLVHGLLMAVALCALHFYLWFSDRKYPLAATVLGWTPLLVLFASPAMAPITRLVMKERRQLRFSEALALGSVLLVLQVVLLLIGSVIAGHTLVQGVSLSSGNSVAVLLGIADLLSILGMTRVYPWVQRTLLRDRARRAR